MARMDPHPDDLRAVLAAVDAGSFGRAAAVLGLSQPALSRRVMRVEAALGGALLERRGTGVAPTPLGAGVLPGLARALRALDEAIEEAREPRGAWKPQVNVACIQTAACLMPPALAGLARVLPEVRVRLLDLSAREGLRALARGDCDLAVNLLPTDDPGLEEEFLFEDPFRLALPAGHPIAAVGSARWGELRRERLIIAARGALNHGLVLSALSAAEGVRSQPWLEVAHLSTALAFVAAGQGVAAVPKVALAEAPPGVVAVPLVGPEVVRRIGLVWRRGETPPPATRRLAEFLRTEAARRPASDVPSS